VNAHLHLEPELCFPTFSGPSTIAPMSASAPWGDSPPCGLVDFGFGLALLAAFAIARQRSRTIATCRVLEAQVDDIYPSDFSWRKSAMESPPRRERWPRNLCISKRAETSDDMRV